MKPLFIPLNAWAYEQFEAGTKTDELRRYGPRWNEKTCIPGRPAILSRGYGTKNRMSGTISAFKKVHGSQLNSAYKEAVLRVYGTLDIDVAVISITDLEDIK
ncbi:hypothetical protein [Nitrosomonas marina]|uniref:ASCH domain-containing protein n=1 Tax=Nitrosomonas marina TaxID=917 RepID=A0A1H8II46_9PROT|nr:hypothetical protein [Nitrosomonas marina]SEN67949.1 hypothetical protein SAMN05216325_1335 [Nitrosomonas marina]